MGWYYNQKKYLKFIQLNQIANKNYKLMTSEQAHNFLNSSFGTHFKCISSMQILANN